MIILNSELKLFSKQLGEKDYSPKKNEKIEQKSRKKVKRKRWRPRKSEPK
jgi:hypothetical protein